MLPFELIYSHGYYLPIGPHVFPAVKYRMIFDWLVEAGIAFPFDMVTPAPASDAQILLVHTRDYVEKLKRGTLSEQERITLEVPYSAALVDFFWLATGGSILAADLALATRGAAINLTGGFHHAFADHGEGFCMINDVSVAIRAMHGCGKLTRALVVDLDVHNGNGTASIFPPAAPLEPHRADDGLRVFTISLHQANNYPWPKPPASIDVDLPDATGDEPYLRVLDRALAAAFRAFDPELICYVAGADPYADDQLGGLALTQHGLKQRDARVLRAARERGIPVMVTLAGGYARRIEDTVAIHCNTVIAAREVYGEASRTA